MCEKDADPAVLRRLVDDMCAAKTEDDKSKIRALLSVYSGADDKDGARTEIERYLAFRDFILAVVDEQTKIMLQHNANIVLVHLLESYE